MEIKTMMKNSSHKHDMNRPRRRHRHKCTKYNLSRLDNVYM